MSFIARDKDGNRKKIAGVGLPGPAGKSAYQYAVEGGFTGTEAEFSALIGVRSNPNLLDNSYWAVRDAIINQRGQTEYTGSVVTIDRWYLWSEKGTATLTIDPNGGINVRIPPGEHATLFTRMSRAEFNTDSMYTLSALHSDGLLDTDTKLPDNFFGALRVQIIGELVQITILDHINGSPSEDYVVGFKAAKLELGPVQTLAHQDASGNWVLNDPPPNKALELAKCQRYYEVLYGQYVNHDISYNEITLPYKVTKRAKPTLTIIDKNNVEGHVSYFDGSQWISVAADVHQPFDIGENADLYAARIAIQNLPSGNNVGYIFKLIADSNL